MLLYVDVIIGAALLAAIGLAAMRRHALPREQVRWVGWLLIAIPLPVAVLVHLTVLHSGRVDQTLFITAVIAFAVGAAIVLGGREDDDGIDVDGSDPKWWPDFERAFRDYSRNQPPSRRKVPT